MYCRPRKLYDSQKAPPISSLPTELLSYIFTLGTHALLESPDVDDGQPGPPFTTDTIRTPLVLSSVSRHWRRVALNTPALWTSLCITIEMVEDLGDAEERPLHHKTTLNTSHITSYLALSRNYPLDILIDARDQDWDFFEPEIPSEHEFDIYTPPFSETHMRTVMSLLLPHLPRWRSLDVLTDSWAPMYVALQQMNPSITSAGAPLLESLTLMRCNDFVSYSPEFQPRALKGPAFLHSPTSPVNIFPRLQNLTLRGVHMDWSSLSSALCKPPSSPHTLRTLELSSHSTEVRPTLREFQGILAATPALRKLVINGSGPVVPDATEAATVAPCDGLSRVSLPLLRDVTLGYRSALEGQKVLELLDAPNVRRMSLEDGKHPGDPEDIDAGRILSYVGTGDVYVSGDHDFLSSYTTLEELPSRFDTAPPSSIRDGKGSVDTHSPRIAFPLIENVTLKGVKSCRQPLQAFFGALHNLHRLELVRMPMYAIQALVPASQAPCLVRADAAPCPCPQLESLCIRGCDRLDYGFIVDGLASERLNKGACGLREVDIHIESGYSKEDMVKVFGSPSGTKVNIFVEASYEEDEEMEYDADGELSAFKRGGVFNDPVFDACFAGRVASW